MRCPFILSVCIVMLYVLGCVGTGMAQGIDVTASIETPTYENVSYSITGSAVYTAIPFPVKGADVTVALLGSNYMEHTINDGTYSVPIDPMSVGVYTAQVYVTDHSVDGTINLVITVVSADADGDGLLDEWEQAIIDADLGDAINTIYDVNPSDDFDGDGITNMGEAVTGTDATNISEFFELETASSHSGTQEIQWPSLTDRVYSVLSSPDLTDSLWTTNLYQRTGTGVTMAYVITNDSTSVEFLRVGVEKP